MSPVCLVPSRRFEDARGWFSETYNEQHLRELGIECRFVQDNHSYSIHEGTIRGLHFQTPPFAQAKLVRCVRGAIFDVAVDVRHASPTFGAWVGAELSAENGLQLFVPAGFAHGFMTLKPETEVTYKVSDFYSAKHDDGVMWNDGDVNVSWPLTTGRSLILSEKDKKLRRLSEFVSPFPYDGHPLEQLKF